MKNLDKDKPLVQPAKNVREYLRGIGRAGGLSGKGSSKRRSKHHYREAALKRWGAEKKRATEANP